MKTLFRTLVFITVFAAATVAQAADIKVFCTNGIRAVVEELLPQFEKTTGNKVVISFEPSTQIKKRIDAGETFDVAFMGRSSGGILAPRPEPVKNESA